MLKSMGVTKSWTQLGHGTTKESRFTSFAFCSSHSGHLSAAGSAAPPPGLGMHFPLCLKHTSFHFSDPCLFTGIPLGILACLHPVEASYSDSVIS